MDDFKIIFQLYVGPKIENLTIFANLNFIFIKTNFIKKIDLPLQTHLLMRLTFSKKKKKW